MNSKVIIFYSKDNVYFADGALDDTSYIVNLLLKAGYMDFDVVETPLDVDTYIKLFYENYQLESNHEI